MDVQVSTTAHARVGRSSEPRALRVRRWKWRMVAVCALCFIFLYVIPSILGSMAAGHMEDAESTFDQCNDGTASLHSADRLYKIQAALPLWSTHARAERKRVPLAARGVITCKKLSLPVAVAALSALQGSWLFTLVRNSIERQWLDERRHKSVIQLYEELGDYADNSRVLAAYLLVGDLTAAANIPGRYTEHRAPSHAAIMCANIDFDGPGFDKTNFDRSVARFEVELRGAIADEYGMDAFLTKYAECLFRGKRDQELSTLLDKYDVGARPRRLERYDVGIKDYYQVAMALRRGDEDQAYTLVAKQRETSCLFAFVAAKRGDWPLAKRRLPNSLKLHDRSERSSFRAPLLAMSPWCEKLVPLFAAGPSAEMREETGFILDFLARQMADRWDPRAESYLDALGALETDFDTAARHRQFAFHHGDWQGAGVEALGPEVMDRFRLSFGEDVEPISDPLVFLKQESANREYNGRLDKQSQRDLTSTIVLGRLVDEQTTAEEDELLRRRRIAQGQPNLLLLPNLFVRR